MPRISDRSIAANQLAQMLAPGIPLSALALYSRWWGLEAWLRELAYIKLRSKFGPRWQGEVSNAAARRRDKDQALAYMRSQDVANLLAYEDTGLLFQLIDELWDIFQPSLLLSQAQWTARSEELREIRNRIGHCRDPHRDDIARVEQTMKDLEQGAWEAVSTYNDTISIERELDDPVVDSWLREGCADARRLVGHAERSYDTSFTLEYSVRPWVTPPAIAGTSPLCGREGVLWSIRFLLRRNRVDPRQLLMQWNEHNPMPECVVHLLANDPAHLRFTISSLEDPIVVIETIGELFDIVLTCAAQWSDYSGDVSAWHQAIGRLDHRAQSDTRLAIVSSDLPHFPILLTSFWTG